LSLAATLCGLLIMQRLVSLMYFIDCLKLQSRNANHHLSVFRSEQIPPSSCRWTSSSSRRHPTKPLRHKQQLRLTMGILSCRPHFSVFHWFQPPALSAFLLAGHLCDVLLLREESRNAYDLQLRYSALSLLPCLLFRSFLSQE
jgi:hypothetical protein